MRRRCISHEAHGKDGVPGGGAVPDAAARWLVRYRYDALRRPQLADLVGVGNPLNP